MSKLSVSKDERMAEIAKVLSNKKRLIIFKFIISNAYSSLSEIHEGTSYETGIRHRETTYKYIKKLKDVKLIKVDYRDKYERFYSEIDIVCFYF